MIVRLKNIQISIKKLTSTAKLPTRGSEYAAGYDLYADSDHAVTIPAHETVMVNTGLSMAIPDGYFGAIFARSGMAAKRQLRPGNCVGVVDSDYRGPVIVALHNDADEDRGIDPYERIAQIVIIPYLGVEFVEADDLGETARGAGGFGSTGTN